MNTLNFLNNVEFSVLLEKAKYYFSGLLSKVDFITLFLLSFVALSIITLIVILCGSSKRGRVKFDFDLISSYFSMSVLLYLFCIFEYFLNRKYFVVFWHTAVLPIIHFSALIVLYVVFYTFTKLGYVIIGEKKEKLDEAFVLSINKNKRDVIINETKKLPCMKNQSLNNIYNNNVNNVAEKEVIKLKTEKRVFEFEREDDLINFSFVAAELDKLKLKNSIGLNYNESKSLIETGGGISYDRRRKLSKLFSYMVKQGAA